MDYVKAEYLEALNKNTNAVEKVKFIPPSPEGDDLGGVSKKYIEETQKAIAELADKKITKFYASSQGNTHLSDSDKGKIQDMFLYGKSEQVQYKGYNKLTLRDKQQINTGIECKPIDSKLQFKGTATSTYCTFDAKEVVISAGKKITAYTDSKHDFFIWFRDSDNKLYVLNKNTKTATYDKNVTIKQFGLQNYQSGDSINEVVDFGLMVGSDDFEPYVGGIPSPNPDYPQEIKAVVNPKVVVRGKNLIEYSNLEAGGLSGINMKDDAYFRIRFKNTIKVIGGETYTITPYKFKNCIGIRCGVHTLTAEHEGIKDSGWIQLKFGEPMTYTMPENAAFCSIVFSFSETSKIVSTNGTERTITISAEDIQDFKAHFERGITTEQSVTLPYTLYAIPVSAEGNVTIGGQQYVADYVDVARGKLVRMCKEIDFTKVIPHVYINKLVSTREARYDYVQNNLKKISNLATVKTGSGYITAVNLIQGATWDNDTVGIGAHGQGDGKCLTLRVPSDTGAKEYFSSIGGCKGVFQIDTPEEIDLTPEQIQAYKSLSTNYPITNIEVSSEQLDGYTIFNYPISMAEGWNYVKQQIGDTRDYIYDMDLQSAEAYVNSEYAVALAELEV